MLVYWVGTSFLICALAFYNRYPLVFSDSGTYIRSAFTLEPPVDRPIGYGLIIRAVTWQSTLWTVVLFQAGMLSWLLWETLRKVLPAGISLPRAHFALVLVLVLCSSMPWYAAQIMPDVLTPMLTLIFYLLLRAPELGVIKRGFLWTCLFFFLIAHNAHVVMATLLVAGLTFVRLVRADRAAWPRFWPNLGGAVVALGSGVLFVAWYNGQNGLRPVFAPASNVFLAARLCENNLLADFLKEHCGDRDYCLCDLKDSLPTAPVDFIWGDNSITTKLGYLTRADSLVKPAVHDLLSEPKYVFRFLRSSLVASMVQLFQVNAVSGMSPYLEGSAPYLEIRKQLPWEFSSYTSSAQSGGAWWDTSFNNRIVQLALILAMCILAWTFRTWRDHGELRILVPLLLAWVMLNAMVTASLANVFDRLQSRVAWLVVMAACVVLVQSPWGRRLLQKPDFCEE
jgi:hypothetical protein